MSGIEHPEVNAENLQTFMRECARAPNQKLRMLQQWADARCAKSAPEPEPKPTPAPEKPKRSSKKAA